MANIIVSSDKVKATEESVRQSFMVHPDDKERGEHAHDVAVHTEEAKEEARIRGSRKYFSF